MLDVTQASIVHVPAGNLYDALKRVKHAMSSEETRYYLNGAFLHHIDGKTKLCATDGHRLAVVDLEDSNVDNAASMPSVILSSAAIGAMLKSGIAKRSHRHHDAPMAVSRSGFALHPYGNPTLEFGMTERPSAEPGIVDGTFPDYLRVIPRGHTQEVTLDREAFRKAVAACFGFAQGASDKSYVAVKFDFAESQCTLSSSYEGGLSTCKVETAAPVSSSMQIGFNGGHVLDILDTFAGNTVTLKLTDPGSPTIFAGDENDSHALHVLMPMRV